MSLTLDGTNGISASGGVNVLQNNSVVTGNLVDSAVTTAKIANDAVTTAKIGNSQVTDAKVAGIAASKITSGTVATARLGSGTANNTTFLRGDQTWQTISTTPTTQQVLDATAGASVGAVGTYAFLGVTTSGTFSAGATLAGSSLRYSGIAQEQQQVGWDSTGPFEIRGIGNGGTPAGTWRAMGRAGENVNNRPATIWLRIS